MRPSQEESRPVQSRRDTDNMSWSWSGRLLALSPPPLPPVIAPNLLFQWLLIVGRWSSNWASRRLLTASRLHRQDVHQVRLLVHTVCMYVTFDGCYMLAAMEAIST
jgi:hypothetical protein